MGEIKMKTLGWVMILLPLVFILMIYYEGGMFGLMLFGLYVFATFCTMISPILGLLIIRGSNYLK